MAEILLLQGIPGSGKTTWARKFIKDNSETWIIINRDSIRNMLGNYWVPKRENLVTKIETNSITEAIKQGFNVIIDATNLNTKTISQFEKLSAELNVTLKYKNFDIPLKTAIRRDWFRGLLGQRSVGKKVVTYFYDRYVKVKKES